jgi:hypothetical protein
MITYFTNHRDADASARHGTITKVFLPYKRVAAIAHVHVDECPVSPLDMERYPYCEGDEICPATFELD